MIAHDGWQQEARTIVNTHTHIIQSVGGECECWYMGLIRGTRWCVLIGGKLSLFLVACAEGTSKLSNLSASFYTLIKHTFVLQSTSIEVIRKKTGVGMIEILRGGGGWIIMKGAPNVGEK